MKLNSAQDRLIGQPPKIGIRPTIDGRYEGVRESLEDITMGMAKVSDGRLIDIELPPPLPPIPNPTDTRDARNWDELRHVLIPNIRI